MALTRLNNRSVSAVTALPSGIDIPAGVILPADLPSGSVIGCIFEANNTKIAATASTSFISINYTPKFTNSKLLVTFSMAIGSTNTNGTTGIRRNGSYIGTQVVSTYAGTIMGHNSAEDSQGTNQDYSINKSIYQILDTPNTTSQVTYDFYWTLASGSSGFYYVNRQLQDNGGSAVSTVSILEIAG
jgi:hypothetical protein